MDDIKDLNSILGYKKPSVAFADRSSLYNLRLDSNFRFAADYDRPTLDSKGKPMVVEQMKPFEIAREISKSASVPVCSAIVQEIVEKANSKIVEKLMDEMRPGFVRMQILQCSTEAAVLGKFKCDHHEVVYDNGDNEEPVSRTLCWCITRVCDRCLLWRTGFSKARSSTVSRCLNYCRVSHPRRKSQGTTLSGAEELPKFSKRQSSV